MTLKYAVFCSVNVSSPWPELCNHLRLPLASRPYITRGHFCCDIGSRRHPSLFRCLGDGRAEVTAQSGQRRWLTAGCLPAEMISSVWTVTEKKWEMNGGKEWDCETAAEKLFCSAGIYVSNTILLLLLSCQAFIRSAVNASVWIHPPIHRRRKNWFELHNNWPLYVIGCLFYCRLPV